MKKRTAPHHELDQKINQTITALSTRQPQDEPPLELCHYTTPDGLMGIVQTNRLWATNIRYLNDFTEFRYTHNLLREITDMILKKVSPLQQTFLRRVIEELNYYDAIFDAYVFCLSEIGDQLSQWREYASRGIGYSIGFKGTNLKRSFHRVGMKLVRVIYDKSEQMRLVERIIIDTCNFLVDIGNRYPERTDDNIIDCCDILMMALTPYTVQFKHQAFSEEREWRIVYIPFQDCRGSTLFPTPGPVLFPTFSVVNFKLHPANLSTFIAC